MEQVASELFFQKLDRPGQRRLGDMTLPGGLREVQMLAYSEKMPDLVHLHALFPRSVSVPYFD
jgi:hypothetical protein